MSTPRSILRSTPRSTPRRDHQGGSRRLLRRGVLYSLLSLVMAGFLFLIFWSTVPQLVTVEAAGAASRITYLDEQLRQWDIYVDQAAKAAAREALNYLTLDHPNFIRWNTFHTVPEVQDALAQCMREGNQTLTPPRPCYQASDRSLAGRLGSYANLSRSHMNVDIDWSLGNVTIEDFQPFLLKMQFELNATFNDTLFAFWNRTRVYTVLVTVEGLPDPLFERLRSPQELNDAADALRLIRNYPRPRSTLTISNITEILNGSYYVADKNFAPTFLQRFAGITDASALDPDGIAGIETLTNVSMWNNLPASHPDEAPYNLSYTGHQVFEWHKTGSPSFHCAIEDGTYGILGVVPNDFRMEARRLARYNVDNASDYNQTCEP